MMSILCLLLCLAIGSLGFQKHKPWQYDNGPKDSSLSPRSERNRSPQFAASNSEGDVQHLESNPGRSRMLNQDRRPQPSNEEATFTISPKTLSYERLDHRDDAGLQGLGPITCYNPKPWLRPINSPACMPTIRYLSAMHNSYIWTPNHQALSFPATHCSIRVGASFLDPGVPIEIEASELVEVVVNILGTCDAQSHGGFRSWYGGIDIAIGGWVEEQSPSLRLNGNLSAGSSLNSPPGRLSQAPSDTTVSRPEPSTRCFSPIETHLEKIDEIVCRKILHVVRLRGRRPVSLRNGFRAGFGLAGCDVNVKRENVGIGGLILVPADDLAYSMQTLLEECVDFGYGGSIEPAPHAWTCTLSNPGGSETRTVSNGIHSANTTALGKRSLSTRTDRGPPHEPTGYCLGQDLPPIDAYLCRSFLVFLQNQGSTELRLQEGVPLFHPGSLCVFSILGPTDGTGAFITIEASELLFIAQTVLRQCRESRVDRSKGRGGYMIMTTAPNRRSIVQFCGVRIAGRSVEELGGVAAPARRNKTRGFDRR